MYQLSTDLRVLTSSQALEDLSTQYDLSVRNSVGGVVQFKYGDDMLDPACLEGDAMPVEYVRSWTHACVRSSLSLKCTADSRSELLLVTVVLCTRTKLPNARQRRSTRQAGSKTVTRSTARTRSISSKTRLSSPWPISAKPAA